MITSNNFYYKKPWYEFLYCYQYAYSKDFSLVKRIREHKETEQDRLDAVEIFRKLWRWHITDQSYFGRIMNYCDETIKLISK